LGENLGHAPRHNHHHGERITRLGLENSAAKLLPPGTLLLSIFATIGRTAVLGIEAATNQAIVGLSVRDRNQLDLDFLRRFLELKTVELEGRARGVAQANINGAILKSLGVPLPPLAEQRRIAEVLDRAEALRAKRRAALAQLNALTQSLFLDLFGDPVTNSKAWKRFEMTEAVVGKYGIKAGPFGSSLKKEDYAESGYRIYGQEQVIAGRFDIGDYYIGERKYQQLKSCAVAEGDLLVSLVGSFGKVLVVPAGIEPGIINPRLLKITPNQTLVTPGFLASLLQHPTVQAEFQRVAHGGTMGILNAGLLKQLKVILPPIPLQREFARRVTAVEALKTAQRASLAELDALFATLQHRAFRGEL
jgi:type I restriction enzyme S subunit